MNQKLCAIMIFAFIRTGSRAWNLPTYGTKSIARRNTFVMLNMSNYSSSSSSLTRTSVRKMKIAELRRELEERGLSTVGLKNDLMNRLLNDLKTKSLRNNSSLWNEGKDKKSESHMESHIEKNGDGGAFVIDPDTLYVLRFYGLQHHLSATSCCGLILYNSSTNQKVWSGTKFYQSGESSNEAELKSLLLTLSNLSKMGLKRLIMQGLASGTTVNQLQGNYGVKKKQLKPILEKIETIIHRDLEECEVWGIATDQMKHLQKQATKSLELETSDGFDIFMKETEHITNKMSQNVKVTEDMHHDEASDTMTGDANSLPCLSQDKMYVLRFDGGSRGNPGVAGAGIAIYDSETGLEVWAAFQYLGQTTNNVAEYEALLSGLNLARAMGVKRITVEGDSTLVVKQVSGEYKVKAEHLMTLNERVKSISETFESFSIRYIPRAENWRADKLANVAMDEKVTMGFEASDLSVHSHGNGDQDVSPLVSNSASSSPIITKDSILPDIISCIPEALVSDRQLSPFRTYVLRFGGKKKGESSLAAAAILLDDLSDENIWDGMFFKDEEDANQFIPAYIGLIIGLRRARAMGVTRLIVESHIEFVIKQMAGNWKVKSEVLQPYYSLAKSIVDDYFEDVDFQVIAKNKNAEIANMIDEAIITQKTLLKGFQ